MVSAHPDWMAPRGEEQFFSDAGAVPVIRSPAGESTRTHVSHGRHPGRAIARPAEVLAGIRGDSLHQRVSSDPRMGRLT